MVNTPAGQVVWNFILVFAVTAWADNDPNVAKTDYRSADLVPVSWSFVLILCEIAVTLGFHPSFEQKQNLEDEDVCQLFFKQAGKEAQWLLQKQIMIRNKLARLRSTVNYFAMTNNNHLKQLLVYFWKHFTVGCQLFHLDPIHCNHVLKCSRLSSTLLKQGLEKPRKINAFFSLSFLVAVCDYFLSLLDPLQLAC